MSRTGDDLAIYTYQTSPPPPPPPRGARGMCTAQPSARRAPVCCTHVSALADADRLRCKSDAPTAHGLEKH